jgi:hypothetical protein
MTSGQNLMSQRRRVCWLAVILLAFSGAVYSYLRWSRVSDATRDALLSAMPADASLVVFADLAALRSTQFAAELFKWAPRPAADAEYAQFLRDTEFDYERDLDRAALAVVKNGADDVLFAVADGRFDRKKISAYALQSGMREVRGGREIFSVMRTDHAGKISFTFLTDNRLAIANGGDFTRLLSPQAGTDANDWRDRFKRLAGSPVFAVIRQDAAAGSALAARVPGGLQSPQLSALLDQLQWITVAGKPQGAALRIVVEGECRAEQTSRQLSDLLSGVLVLAQAGLSAPEARHQLDPQAREAYLEVLKGADISRIDRGETKSVRLVLDITPKLLEAAKSSMPSLPAQTPETKTPPAKARRRGSSKQKSTD